MGNERRDGRSYAPPEYRDVDYAVLSTQIWEQVRNGQIDPRALVKGQLAGITFNDSGDLAPRSRSSVYVGKIAGIEERKLPWNKGKAWDVSLEDHPYWMIFGYTPISEGSPILNSHRVPKYDEHPITQTFYERRETMYFAPWQNPHDSLGIPGALAFSVTTELMEELGRVAGFIPDVSKLFASYGVQSAV